MNLSRHASIHPQTHLEACHQGRHAEHLFPVLENRKGNIYFEVAVKEC